MDSLKANFLFLKDTLTAALISDGNLDPKYEFRFKETLSHQHIHQYQKEYHKELNYGRKKKVVKKANEEIESNKIEEKIAQRPVQRQISGNFNFYNFLNDLTNYRLYLFKQIVWVAY